MFPGEDILDFINKIINQVDDESANIEENLRQFRMYLELTAMCDGETLSRIDSILDCTEYFIALRNKFGYVDVKTIVNSEESKPKTLKKVPKRKKTDSSKYTDKHYGHYVSGSSSSCGSSSPSSSSCGASLSLHSSYSSGCYGSSSYRGRC